MGYVGKVEDGAAVRKGKAKELTGGKAAGERKIIACLRKNQLVLSTERTVILRKMKVHLIHLRLL